MGNPATPTDSTPPQELTNENPADFSFVVPSEFVTLPSQGRLYPEGHPLHNQATLEIKQMTAKEEDMLTSRALLKKGIAIDRVIQSLVRDKRINTNNMLVGDRNAIMIAARISAYGNVYNTTVTCPACETSQKYSFDLNEIDIYDGSGLTANEAVDNGDGTLTTLLPRLGAEVTLRLLTGDDERQYVSRIENRRKKRQAESTITTQMQSLIVSVNGDNNPNLIRQLVENLPSMDVRHIQLVLKLATPNMDMVQHFDCEVCDHEEDLEVPLSADFFWPDL
jgi:hypothetical protein